jgi:hypothetical protein
MLGTLGAAIANGAALSVMNLASLAHTRISLGYWPYDMRYVKGLIAACASAGTLLFLQSLHVMDNLGSIWLIVVCFISSTVVFGLVLLLLGFDPDDKIIAALLGKRLLGLRNKA